MKPYNHARNSVKKWKGHISDYMPIHNFIDSSKAHFADVRHRALLHSTFGIFLLEQVFGITITNSDGITISVRDIGEQHVLEDLGHIPCVADYLNSMTLEKWMGGPKDKTHLILFLGLVVLKQLLHYL